MRLASRLLQEKASSAFLEIEESCKNFQNKTSFIKSNIIFHFFILEVSFIIQFFKGSHDVGIYSAAFQFALGFSLLFAAISTVFLPRLSEIKGKENFIKSAKKVFQASSVLAVASLPLFFLSGTLMNFFFGDKYIESASIFNVLLIGYVLALYTAPISVYFYAWRKPKVLTGLNYIQLLVALTLNLLLVPKFGAVGGAFAWLASSLIGIPYLIYFFVKHLYTMEK